jgi:glycosyltransferase involved in cell wall biosynthesis
MDVVICTLNSEHSIEACIESVVREVAVQRIHIVDGGSTDATLDIVRRFPQVTVHLRPDLSLGQSRAFSFTLPQTDWFLQIDSDVVLREGWARVAAEHLGRADVLEFGTVNHWEFLNPPPEAVRTRAYERRAFFFTNVMRTEAVRAINLDFPPLQDWEEELTRRRMSELGFSWLKTGITHADHCSRPVRYDGRSIGKVVRARPFPVFTHFNRGRVDGLTGVGPLRAILTLLRVMAETLMGPVLSIIGAVGNPFSAAGAYLRGYSAGHWRRSTSVNHVGATEEKTRIRAD